MDFSIVHPREIFKVAVLANASKLMLVHVHPSGSLVQSRDDVRVTDRLLQLCEMMGIPLLDHVIVAGENKNYFSFREKGILEYKPVKYLKENMSNIPDVKMYVIIGMINRILTVQNSWNQDMSIHIEDVNNGNNSAEELLVFQGSERIAEIELKFMKQYFVDYIENLKKEMEK